MSFAILPIGEPIALTSHKKQEEEQNHIKDEIQKTASDVIFQLFFESIFPSSSKDATTSNNNATHKWYDSIFFFPLWIFFYLFKSSNNAKSREGDDGEKESLLHNHNTTTEDEDAIMVQSKKVESSFLSFHILSKKRFLHNFPYERSRSNINKTSSNTSSLSSGESSTSCKYYDNMIILDYGKIALFSTTNYIDDDNGNMNDNAADISYTNDYKTLQKKHSASKDDDVVHTRMIYIPEKNECIISWGALNNGIVYIYQFIPKSSRSDDNIGWKVVSKIYPHLKLQVNNFVTEMIRLDVSKYEFIIVSRCNGTLEIVPYGEEGRSVGMHASQYHRDISCLDIMNVKSSTTTEKNNDVYSLVAAGTSTQTGTTILTFYSIVLDKESCQVVSMELVHEITFADRLISLFSHEQENEEEVDVITCPKVLEMNVPILQVLYLANDSNNKLALLDYYGNVTILTLAFDDNGDTMSISSTMVLGTTCNIIQMNLSSDEKYLITATSDSIMDIYDIQAKEEDEVYSCIFHTSFNQHCHNVVLFPSVLHEEKNSIISILLLQSTSSSTNNNNTSELMQVGTIQHMTNNEAYNFYIQRNDYHSALSVAQNISEKDTCHEKLWESINNNTKESISFWIVHDYLQKYWIYIENEEYIYQSCIHMENMIGLEEEDGNVEYSILYTMYTTAMKICVHHNIAPIQERYQKLILYKNLSSYYHTSFSFTIFHERILSNPNITQELTLSCAQCGDFLPMIFLLLFGFKRISSWSEIFDSLNLELHPYSFSYLFPIVDEYGFVGFVLDEQQHDHDSSSSNSYVSYSPLEVVEYLKKCHPCELWNDTTATASIIDKEARIQISLKEKENLQRFYTQRVTHLIQYTQHLPWIMEQCSISKDRLSYYTPKSQEEDEDYIFLSTIQKSSSYLHQCILQDIYPITMTLQQFSTISISKHVSTILGYDDNDDITIDTTNMIVERYNSLVVPIVSDLYQVKSVEIEEYMIDYVLYRLKNNKFSSASSSLFVIYHVIFEYSRTVLPWNKRIISSPIQILQLFLQVATIISNSWLSSSLSYSDVKQQIDIVWKCYECLPIRFNVLSGYEETQKKKLHLLQDEIQECYKFWIVIDILSRYTYSTTTTPPSLSFLSTRCRQSKGKLLQDDIFPFLLYNFFSNDQSSVGIDTTTSFPEFLLDIVQIQYCLLSGEMDDDNEEKDNIMKTFVLDQTLPLILQHRQWKYIPILMDQFQQYTSLIQSVIFHKIQQCLSLSTATSSSQSLHELQQGVIVPLCQDIQSLLLPEYRTVYENIIRYMDFCYYMLDSVKNTTPSSAIVLLPFETFSQSRTEIPKILDWIQNMISESNQSSSGLLFHSQRYWLKEEYAKQTCLNIISYRTTTNMKALPSCSKLWQEFLLPGNKFFGILPYFFLKDDIYDITLSYFIFHTLVVEERYPWIAICCATVLMPSLIKNNKQHPQQDAFWEDVMSLLTYLQQQNKNEMTKQQDEKNILLYFCRECLLHCNTTMNDSSTSASSIRNPFIVLDIITNLEYRNVITSLEAPHPPSSTVIPQQQQYSISKQNPKQADFFVFQVGNLVAKRMTKILSTNGDNPSTTTTTATARTKEEMNNSSNHQYYIISIPKFPIPLIISDSYEHIHMSIQSIMTQFLQHYNLTSSTSSLYNNDWIIPYITVVILSLQDLDKISSFLPHPLPSPPPPLPPTVLPRADPSIVHYLEGTGYTRSSAIKCAIMTHNQGCSQALEYAIHHERNEDFTYPLCIVANNTTNPFVKGEKEQWKKQYCHCELVHHANMILKDFLNEGVLFISKHGSVGSSNIRDFTPLSAARNDMTMANIAPFLPQPPTNNPGNLPKMELFQQQPSATPSLTDSATKTTVVSPPPPPAKVPSDRLRMNVSQTQPYSQRAPMITTTSSPRIKTHIKTTNVPQPPPTPSTTSNHNKMEFLEQTTSSQQTPSIATLAKMNVNTKISKVPPSTQPLPLPASNGRLNINFLKKPPSQQSDTISSAPSSKTNTKAIRNVVPPPPPKSLPSNRLKMELFQSKPKPPPTTVPSITQLSIEERKRLAKEGRKLFLQVRNNTTNSKQQSRLIKAVVEPNEKVETKNNDNNNTIVKNISTASASIINNNGQCDDISTTTSNPPSSSCSIPADGWDFDDTSTTPPTNTNGQCDDSSVPPSSSCSVQNDGWDFDDF